MTIQTIFQYLQDDINNRAEDDKIWRAINTAARTMTRSYAWSWLRRTVTVTTTADASQGYLMPSNMVDVIDPVDDGNGLIYARVDPALMKNLPTDYRQFYFFDPTATTALADTSGITVNKGSTALTFSTALPSGDHTGEFIRISDNDGKDYGVHELASNSALVTAWKGPRINDGYYVLRPTTTKRLSFVDYDGNRIATTAIVNYWVYPNILLDQSQEIPDVWEMPLRLLAGLELSTATYDKKSEEIRLSRINQYNAALGQAQVDDGRPAMVDIPMDEAGCRRTMGWRNRPRRYYTETQ